MADLEKLRQNLTARGYACQVFDTPQEAVCHLQNSLREFYGCDPPVTDLARRLMEDQQTSARQLARWGEGGIVS